MLPFPDSRMQIAVSHLQDQVASARESHDGEIRHIILLSECLASDLKLLSSRPWIRANFAITELDTSHWASGRYGTTMLTDRRLNITSCFRVHYRHTNMQRDGLFEDITQGPLGKQLRIGNTHLESLRRVPPLRPAQMQVLVRYLQDCNVHADILAGDLNAIEQFDRTLHSENGLKDAFLELGGKEDDPDGHTWGQQAMTFLRDQFGTSRMDKVLFCGQVKLVAFSTFGFDLEVADEKERNALVALGLEKPWITDHLGVLATFTVD